MQFLKQYPNDSLKHIVKCFWMIDSEGDNTVHLEKIIPDGFPEMIFHYKDPYHINISGRWEQQESFLIAGQITNHFYLKNSGESGLFAIKFQPSALKSMFNIDMRELTNKVIPFNSTLMNTLTPLISIAICDKSFVSKVSLIEGWLLSFLPDKQSKENTLETTINLINQNHGQLNLEKFTEIHKINKRTLERNFKKHIGLSPKLYMRIIRFSHIFKLIQSEAFDWSDISFLAGYYDQSHFIKNFKEFTGENPSSYGFDDQTIANFFLKK